MKNYPKTYKRNVQSKLLYLYKTGIITHSQFLKARFFYAMMKAKESGKFGDALIEINAWLKK